MSASQLYPCSEVYIWLGRDEQNNVINSFEGFDTYGQVTKKNKVYARCGHVAMSIFQSATQDTYVSCWPTKGGSSKAQLISSLQNDIQNEGPKDGKETGALPDAIIHLGKLNVNKMLEDFAIIQKRVNNGEITWTFDVSDSEDISKSTNTRANCATVVYTLLKSGGLDDSCHIYNSIPSRNRGPYDSVFYNQTRCHLGDILGGRFNGAPWTQLYLTPKAVLYHAAAAAGQDSFDKELTIKNMRSHRVTKTIKENTGGIGKSIARGVQAVISITIVAIAILGSK